MERSLAVVQGEVAGLDQRKAALLSQLAQVDALLAQAHARKVGPLPPLLRLQTPGLALQAGASALLLVHM